MSSRKEKGSKPKKGILRSVGLVIVAIYFCFVMMDMKVNISERSEELVAQQQKLEEQRVINKDTQRQLAQSGDQDEVERKAREMGFVKKNEIIFKDSSGN